jgi:2-polyprenyl-3-methyl-5-hydroxy-6-metoxy-1,4-benzoquinol methylase
MQNKAIISTKSADKYDSEDFGVYSRIERHEMLGYIPKEASIILDVGCAVGSFGKLIKSQCLCEVWGVEINEYAASVAAQKLDKVICGAFDEKLDLPKSNFDCIIFNDVLEHLVDPFSALLFAKTLLRDGGKVVASIPNVRYFDNMWRLLVDRDWEYTQSGILDRTHLRFFTHNSIVKTFNDLGYDIEAIEGINPIEEFHPYRVRKFRFINYLLFNQIEDMRYLQFAIVAKPNQSSKLV